MVIIIGLLVICLVPFSQGDMVCLSCSMVVNPRDCETIIRCGSGESCYSEAVVTTLGYIRYNLGCHQCGSGSFIGRRTVHTDPVTNGECCDTQLCNSAPFGLAGYPPRSSRGPICYNCQEQVGRSDCNRITMCGRDQKCRFSSKSNALASTRLYTTKCSESSSCPKQSLPGFICDYCCDQELCNHACSRSSAQQTTSAPIVMTSDPCNPSPCVSGTCSHYLNTYRCTCPLGVHGKNCELSVSVDHCISNPCYYGTCSSTVSTPQGFTCTCSPGYIGLTCDTRCHLDIIFMLDESASFGQAAFQQAVQFVKSIVSALDIGTNGNQVGLMVYNDQPHLQWNLNHYTTKAQLLRALGFISFYGGITRTDLALKFVRENMLLVQNGDRVNARNVIIVITDGHSSAHSGTVTEARKLHTSNNLVIAVGVGATNDQELIDLATDKAHVVKVSSYHSLPIAVNYTLPLMC